MPTYRLVSLTKAGKPQQRDYDDVAPLTRRYEQIGIEEDSYTMRLHGEPVFKGLIGPLSDGRSVVRYETPDAFAMITEAVSKEQKTRRRRRRVS